MLTSSSPQTFICVIYSQQNRLDGALNQEEAHSVTFAGCNWSVFTKDSERCLHLKLRHACEGNAPSYKGLHLTDANKGRRYYFLGFYRVFLF